MNDAEQKLLEIVKPDFKAYLKLCFMKYLNLPEPTWIQYEIADYLQYGPQHRIILSYRGAAKSTISACYVTWRLLNNPNELFLIVSATHEKAKDFSFEVKKLIATMPILRHLEPKRENDDRTSVISFDVAAKTKITQDPSVRCRGISANITGGRATEIIADDIEVPNTCDTADKRDSLFKACLEFTHLGVDETARITYLGTPHDTDSIYNKLKNHGFSRRIWPARYPLIEKIPNYDEDLAPSILEKLEETPDFVWEPTDPMRFDEAELQKREARAGRSGFMLQYMLDTGLSDEEKYPLKLRDLIVTPLETSAGPQFIRYASDREKQIKEIPLINVSLPGDRLYRPMEEGSCIPYQKSIMVIDVSGGGSDETAFIVLKLLHSKLFLVDAGGYKGTGPLTLVGISEKIKEHQVSVLLYERNYGGDMFMNLIKPYVQGYHPLTIEPYFSTKHKETRIIQTLEPVLNSHKLVIDLSLVQRDVRICNDPQTKPYSLLYQLTHISKVSGSLKHDDKVDALAKGVEYFSGALSKSEEQALKEFQQRQIEEELDRFLARIGKPRTMLWNPDMAETW